MSAMVSMSVLSTQYLLVPVQSLIAGLATDPTGYPVQFAFTPTGSDPSVWVDANWQDGTTNGMYLAQCLIGPSNGGTVLASGTYEIWVKITADPEVPVLQPGLLQVIA